MFFLTIKTLKIALAIAFTNTALVAFLFVNDSVQAAKRRDVDQLLETKECAECNLRGARLAGAELNGANLQSADLSQSNLRGVKLSGADLLTANLAEADLQEGRRGDDEARKHAQDGGRQQGLCALRLVRKFCFLDVQRVFAV